MREISYFVISMVLVTRIFIKCIVVDCPISIWAIFFKLTCLRLEVNPYVIMHFSIEYCNTC